MKPLALNELVRKGEPYMNRHNTLLQKIVNGDLLQLADEEGYVKVQSVKVTFKDGTESNYTREELKKPAVGQAFLSDIISVANQARSRKAQVLLTGSGSDHDPSIIGTWNLKELGKTHHFGGQSSGGPKVNLGNQYVVYIFIVVFIAAYLSVGNSIADYLLIFQKQYTAFVP